jgi:hypothetical protein
VKTGPLFRKETKRDTLYVPRRKRRKIRSKKRT